MLRVQDELSRALDRGLGEGEALNGWAPAVDVYEDAEGILLRAEVPGMTAADIELRIENNVLSIKGERKLERADRKDNYRRIERNYGVFTRSFTLPTNVDTEKVRADAKHGVLSIFLPRREESKP
jgi:HSP20 family protein